MFFLPRICEHCLNPSCVASCPSGAMYKREEDGIVLVDQDRCRGWRYCVSGCPYKKVYFNHRTGKAEKCTLCYPRIEIGQPTICSETCVGRIRYLGLVLYDADRVQEAASVPDERDLLAAQRDVFLDPEDPEVRGRRARATASPATGSTRRGARRSTTWPCAGAWRCRCTPSSARCRWSGTCRRSRPSSRRSRSTATRPTPTTSSAPSSTCGSRSSTWPTCSPPATSTPCAPCCTGSPPCAPTCASARCSARSTTSLPARVGLTGRELERMYRLLAIADYEDRYVIPQAHAELGERLMQEQGGCGLDFDGRPRQLRRGRPAAGHLVAGGPLRRRELPPDRHPQARRAPRSMRRPRTAEAVPDRGRCCPSCCATRARRSPARATSSPRRSPRSRTERRAWRWSASWPAGPATRRRSRPATSRPSTCAGGPACT